MTGFNDRLSTFLNNHLGSRSAAQSPGPRDQVPSDRRGSRQLSPQERIEQSLATYSAWYQEREVWANKTTDELIEEIGRRAESDDWQTDNYTQRAIRELAWRMEISEQQAQEEHERLELQEALRKVEADRIRKAKIIARVQQARAAGKTPAARDEIVLLRDRIEEFEQELEALRNQIGAASDHSERYDSLDDLRPPPNC